MAKKDIPLTELLQTAQLAMKMDQEYGRPGIQARAKEIAAKALELIADKIGLK